MGEKSPDSAVNLREISRQLLKEIENNKKDDEKGLGKVFIMIYIYGNRSFRQRVISPTVSSPTTWDDSPTFLCHILGQSIPWNFFLIKVKGSSGKIYNCLMTSEFCTCPSYIYFGKKLI